MSEGGYVYDQQFAEERQRLAGMAALWDPGSQALIERLGIGPGARVLEVGGGGGALVEWLCGLVGQSGRVVATDVDVRFLSLIEHPAIAVHEHDVVAEDLPDTGFDLIHTRLVLEHLPAREAVLDKFVAALNPGGWLVAEDYAWRSFTSAPEDPMLDTIGDAVLGFMADNGFDSELGIKLPALLRARGLEDVAGEGRSLVLTLDHPGAAFFKLSLASLAPALVELGRLDQATADRGLALMEDATREIHTPVMVAAYGRRR